MKKGIIVIAILGGSLLFGANTVQGQILIKIKPPAPKVVVVKPKKPKPNYVWVSGYWKWNKKINRYSWVNGKWCKPKKGKVWVPARYNKVRGGYSFVPGHWRRV